MNPSITACRTSNVQKVTVACDVEKATIIGFEHEAGLMLFVPADVDLGRVTVFAAARKEGPFLPVVGGEFNAEPGTAIPITVAFAAPFVKFVANVGGESHSVELDVSLTS